AGRDDGVDARVGTPGCDDGAYALYLVRRNRAVDKFVAGVPNKIGECAAGLVVGKRPAVGNRQHGETHGDEGAIRHGRIQALQPWWTWRGRTTRDAGPRLPPRRARLQPECRRYRSRWHPSQTCGPSRHLPP